MLKVGDRVRVVNDENGPRNNWVGHIVNEFVTPAGECVPAHVRYKVEFRDKSYTFYGPYNLQKDNSWIGVDLDGTLAYYDGVWRGLEYIGRPIQQTVKFVQALLNQGEDVRIFTARCGRPNKYGEASTPIRKWCREHIGEALMITCEKDMYCRAIYDDIAHPVKRNEGVVL